MNHWLQLEESRTPINNRQMEIDASQEGSSVTRNGLAWRHYYPERPKTPGSAEDNQEFLGAFLRVTRTGSPWREFPEAIGLRQ